MEQIKYYIEKYKVILILAFVILGLSIGLIFSIVNKKEDKIETNVLDNKVYEKEEVIVVDKVKVDIKGMIENPGVYELEENDRVIDVIEMAGGLKEGANTEYINLSKKLVDEMVIIIYSNDAVEKYKETEKEIIYIEYECVCPDNINDSCITKDDVVNTNGVEEKKESDKENSKDESNEENQLVSINSSSKEELMTLPGIGETKAIAIIEYREKNGEFKKLEDIKNVSGIGDSAYSKIKDLIKL